MSATLRGEIQRTADEFAEAIRRRDREAAERLIASYAEVRERLAAQYETLLAEIERRHMDGEEVSRQLSNRFSRVSTLLRQADEELLGWADVAAVEITERQRAAVLAAQADQARMASTVMGPGPGGLTATFNRLPVEALADLVGVLADGSPLADLLAAYGRVASEGLRSALINGLAQGLHLTEIARNMRAAMDGDAVRALTVARTEVLRAYRESSRRFFGANADLVGGWIWWSARDERTCAVCWAMHGSRHSLDEPFGGHPNCRCTMLPITKTWGELGFRGVPNDGRIAVPDGPTLFARLAPETQRAILGAGKYAAYRAGDLDLADVVKTTRDPRWGITRSERSLRDILAT